MKMRKFLQNKLWRDKIVEKRYNQPTSQVHYKVLDDSEYDEQLRLKLIEEAQEVKKTDSQEELIKELADVFEVIDTLCSLHKIAKEDIYKQQEKKRELSGGFAKRYYVSVAEHAPGTEGEAYCLAQPDKYPEMF